MELMLQGERQARSLSEGYSVLDLRDEVIEKKYKVVKRRKVAQASWRREHSSTDQKEGGRTRQRAGKHRVPKYKGPEERAGVCFEEAQGGQCS